MTFPMLFEIGLHAYVETTTDGYGDQIRVYNPPLDQPGTPVKVYGWEAPIAFRGAGEPRRTGVEERVIVDIELLVGPDYPGVARDVVDLPDSPGGQFETFGEPEDFTRGPFGWASGKLVNLRKVAG